MTTILEKSKKLLDGKKIIVTKNYPNYSVTSGDIYLADEVVQNGEYVYKFFNKEDQVCYIPTSDAVPYLNRDDEIISRIIEMTTEIRKMSVELTELHNLVKERNR
jgi:hypothetical protein